MGLALSTLSFTLSSPPIWSKSAVLQSCTLFTLIFRQQTFLLSVGQLQVSLMSPALRTSFVITVTGQTWV